MKLLYSYASRETSLPPHLIQHIDNNNLSNGETFQIIKAHQSVILQDIHNENYKKVQLDKEHIIHQIKLHDNNADTSSSANQF